MIKIIVEKNRRGKWFWKIRAKNGKILAHSEDYSSKRNCVDTVLNVMKAQLIIYTDGGKREKEAR